MEVNELLEEVKEGNFTLPHGSVIVYNGKDDEPIEGIVLSSTPWREYKVACKNISEKQEVKQTAIKEITFVPHFPEKLELYRAEKFVKDVTDEDSSKKSFCHLINNEPDYDKVANAIKLLSEINKRMITECLTDFLTGKTSNSENVLIANLGVAQYLLDAKEKYFKDSEKKKREVDV